MTAAGLLHLLHVLGVLHLFRVPREAFCMLDRVREVSRGVTYCIPRHALELWLRA